MQLSKIQIGFSYRASMANMWLTDPHCLISHLQVDKSKATPKMQVLFPRVYLQPLIQLDQINKPRCVAMCMCMHVWPSICWILHYEYVSNLITKLIDFIITNKYLNLDMGWIITFSMWCNIEIYVDNFAQKQSFT